MERSSRVLQHGNPKIWIFFQNFEIDEIEFCPYAEKRNFYWNFNSILKYYVAFMPEDDFGIKLKASKK